MAVASCPTVLYFSPATTDYRPFLSFCYGMNVINNFSNKYLVAKEKTANKKSVFHERISGLILNFRQVLSCYGMMYLPYSLKSTVIRKLSISQNQTEGCGALTHHAVRAESVCITAPHLSCYPQY